MPVNTSFAVKVTWPQLPPRKIWHDEQVKLSSNLTKEDVQMNQGGKPSQSDKAYIPIADKGAPSAQPGSWEYLDHTADVQLHAWAESRKEAYAAAVISLHGYIVDTTDIGHDLRINIHASGHDEHSLLYAMLDEFLYLFCTESFVVTRATVQHLDVQGDQRRVEVIAWGGYFKQGVHPQGTEVKAITYSNMQVVQNNKDHKFHVYVIVDI